MPKLTRPTFIEAVRDLRMLAERNFVKDEYLHGCLVAVDQMSRQHFFMQGPEDDPRIHASGFVPIPGPWTDHLPKIEAHLRAWKAVAAILIGEGWMVADDDALETLRMDIHPHEHPMKNEVAMVVGVWPREHVAFGYRAIIERDERGQNPHLSDFEEFGTGNPDMIGTWLSSLLPQPH